MADTDTQTEVTDNNPDETLEESKQGGQPGATETKQEKTEPEATASKEESKEEPEDTKEDKEKDISEDKEPKDDKEKEDKADPKIEKLNDSIKEKETEISDLKGKLDTQKEEAKKNKSRAEELEKVISGVVENKVSGIPEAYKELMPENDPIKQLEWLSKAEEKGLFAKEKSENPEVEVGKNISLDKKGENEAKREVSSHQRLSNYFSKAFTGK